MLSAIICYGINPIVLKTYPETSRQKQMIRNTGIILTVWLVYIAGLSLTGIFTIVTLPPRIPLLLVFPAFLFISWFFISGRFRIIIEATPLHWIILLQSFRIIVELLIYWCYNEGILPKEATFRGNNFDIIFGLTAPLVAWSVRFNKKGSNINYLIWNFCGLLSLAIVVFTLISTAYFPALWGRPQSILNDGFGKFPFTYIAGFLMPLAVFLHLFAIIKIRRLIKPILT
jgi:hypothetical protein